MNITFLNRIKKITIWALLTSILFNYNCWNENSQSDEIKETTQWEEVKIDSDISKDSIYKRLDKEEEIFSVYQEQDTLMRKTSDVEYYSGEQIIIKKTEFSKFNNCRTYFFHSDTLSINIGIGDGFVYQGFVIRYKNNKFYTEPYYWSDGNPEGVFDATYKIVYQKLTLDKPNYKSGDSLYGKIEFKSIETNKYKGRIEHFGQGNFRTKIAKG